MAAGARDFFESLKQLRLSSSLTDSWHSLTTSTGTSLPFHFLLPLSSRVSLGFASQYRKKGPIQYCCSPWLIWKWGKPQSSSCSSPGRGFCNQQYKVPSLARDNEVEWVLPSITCSLPRSPGSPEPPATATPWQSRATPAAMNPAPCTTIPSRLPGLGRSGPGTFPFLPQPVSQGERRNRWVPASACALYLVSPRVLP